MKAIRLRCEYLKNPIGTDVENPRLFWNCEGGVTQSAYRILATDDENNTLWDSGKVKSSQMTGIIYPLNLLSRQRVNWKVKLWDENDTEGEWSDKAYFEIGLKRSGDWKAKWITGDYDANKQNTAIKKKFGHTYLYKAYEYVAELISDETPERFPVDCFKKEFSSGKQVKSARLYATACGIYSVSLNGTTVSMPLAPGITDYRKRIYYQTYDVTSLIKENNIIEASLADGWYRGSVGAWGLKNQYGTETKFLAQLEIVYSDGSKQTIVSDKSWAWSNDGKISFADNKDGEIVDARKHPSYKGIAKETSHNVVPTASNNVPIAEKETFKGTLTKTPGGKYLLDFKQNMAGYISFKINAKAGQRIKIRFGEMLVDGELSLKNIQISNKKMTTPLQTVDYTCRDGENNYKTKFAIFGFRYAEIETDIAVNADDFTAIAVYSDFEQTGFFDSSNKLLNKFVEATIWSTKSNSTDIPTDCPTRERHGWTGDAQIFCGTANYLFDYFSFSRKFEKDIIDTQKKNGNIKQIAPDGGVDFYMRTMDGSAGWSDAVVYIPYVLFRMYRDKSILADNYDAMKSFAKFKIGTMGKPYMTALPTGINPKYAGYISNYGQSYGEWAEPADVKAFEIADFVSPHPEETTAYLVYMLECMAEIADTLGKNDDKIYFGKYAEKAKAGYKQLVKTKKFSLDTDRQAKLVRPLYFDLLDEKQKEYAQSRLLKALENYGWRLGTGFLSTPLILDVLSEIDIEYAYKLLENEEMPGWLFMPKMGATTIWESWEGTEAQGGIASLNHYSKGAVCEWLFSAMCGINISGENHFVIRPMPGGHFEYANAEYKSVFGTVKSGWVRENGKTIFNITIPSNITAQVILPDGQKKEIKTGNYTFETGE